MSFSHPAWPRFLPTSTVLGWARLGPVGRLRKAPGTWGSVAGLAYFVVIFHSLSTGAVLLLSAVTIYLAAALCGEAEVRLGRRDPGEVVLDEFVVLPLCFVEWPLMTKAAPAWAVFLAGFGLFRLYDILKPFGIRRLQDLPGGWGVVIDDVAAALATCATLHVGAALMVHFSR